MKSEKKGFTLIELLVVVAIIAMLATVVLAALGSARNKGADASVKSNLTNARAQGEIFYNTNTAAPNSYTSVCTNGNGGGTLGAVGVGSMIQNAVKATGLSSYTINGTGTLTTATCNDSSTAWAAEVPLKAGGMWCVDSTGKSKNAGVVTIGAGTACN